MLSFAKLLLVFVMATYHQEIVPQVHAIDGKSKKTSKRFVNSYKNLKRSRRKLTFKSVKFSKKKGDDDDDDDYGYYSYNEKKSKSKGDKKNGYYEKKSKSKGKSPTRAPTSPTRLPTVNPTRGIS